MYSNKMLLTAAAVAVLSATGAGSAYAAPWDHHRFGPEARHEVMRHAMRRPVVVRQRVFETLRFHHFRGLGEPYFLHGRYVVRSFNRYGQVVLVEIDPYTGAFIGSARI